MTKLELSYPFKRFFVTQHWGNRLLDANGDPVYARFGFELHNGIDARASTNKNDPDHTKWPIYCPAKGFVVQSVRHSNRGGGVMLFLVSKEPVEMFEKTCHAWLVFMHCHKILVPVGYEPKEGELLAVADNTGFSTGPHTHFGLYRVTWDGMSVKKIDENRADGSFDPSLFWTDEYAVDRASRQTALRSAFRYYKYVLNNLNIFKTSP